MSIPSIIAITAAQSAGKTTLITRLSECHGHYVVARKSSRSIQTDWGVTLDQINSDPELTIKFQDEILARKLADDTSTYLEVQRRHTPLQHPIIFTERSPVDLFVYSLMALGGVQSRSDWLDNYYHQCVSALAGYDNVVFIEGGHFAPQVEAQRASVNKHYTKLVDDTMRKYFDVMVPTSRQIIVNCLDIDDRCDQVLSQI
jgi:predicted ATPase